MSQATPLRHAGKPAQAADVVRINVSGTKYSVGKFLLQENFDPVECLVTTDIQFIRDCWFSTSFLYNI